MEVTRNTPLKLMIFIEGVFTGDNAKLWFECSLSCLPQGRMANYSVKTEPHWHSQDVSHCRNFWMDYFVQGIMGNEHTFVEVFFTIVCDRPAGVGRSIDEGVLMAHTALNNKIHLKNYKLISILRAPKWSGINQILDICRRACCIQLYH